MSDERKKPTTEQRLKLLATLQRDGEAHSSFAAPTGSESDALIIAFVQGVQWWEYRRCGAMLWNNDRNKAEDEAEKRLRIGTLGKFPNSEVSGGAKTP